VVNTIAATTTATGLTVTAVLDAGRYPVGTEISDAQMKDLEDRVIARHGFHGDWNYTLLAVPRPAPDPGPEPPPPRTAPDLAALDQPALTCRPAAPPPWPPPWPSRTPPTAQPGCTPAAAAAPASAPTPPATTPGTR
jgi:Rhodopirellula transposase DDE domain